MTIRIRDCLRISLLAALVIFSVPAAGHADDLFRLFLEGQANGFYGDNIGFQSNNQIGDFGSTLVAGFYLDYSSAARYASLHFDTFAQLFLHRSQLDRAGEGQFVNATDDENISRTTKLRFEDLFYRAAPTDVAVTTSTQAPAFNTLLTQLLIADFQASVNHFGATLWHEWGRGWSTEANVHQTTFWSNNGSGQSSYAQGFSTNTGYHFSPGFFLGGGYRYNDFQFTAPGRPDAQTQWPFARIIWYQMKNLYFSGIVGVLISHTQGQNTKLNPGGIGWLDYSFQRGHLSVYGGQEPELVSALGAVGLIRYVRGNALYYFAPRVTGTAGAGFEQANGQGFNAESVSWGVGVSDRINRYVNIYARFVEARVIEHTSNKQFLPNGIQSGQGTTANYITVGFSVSFEALRWSWQ